MKRKWSRSAFRRGTCPECGELALFLREDHPERCRAYSRRRLLTRLCDLWFVFIILAVCWAVWVAAAR